jgi:hypothetical protein
MRCAGYERAATTSASLPPMPLQRRPQKSRHRLVLPPLRLAVFGARYCRGRARSRAGGEREQRPPGRVSTTPLGSSNTTHVAAQAKTRAKSLKYYLVNGIIHVARASNSWRLLPDGREPPDPWQFGCFTKMAGWKGCALPGTAAARAQDEDDGRPEFAARSPA